MDGRMDEWISGCREMTDGSEMSERAAWLEMDVWGPWRGR